MNMAGVKVYDIDLFDASSSDITTLHNNGMKVICYFSAGTYEDWRPDASSFSSSDYKNSVEGWPGEWWLNTKSANVRKIMTSRIQKAQSLGCDGVDPDNVDGYGDNNTGFNLTTSDATNYVNFMAGVAHPLGLAIGLKNAGDIINDALVANLEWEVNEQCAEYSECTTFDPFIKAGKPVFHIEYPNGVPNVDSSTKQKDCSADGTSGFSTVLKTMDLTETVEYC
jgi:hypothetical protein